MANLSPHRLACRTISSDGKQPQHIGHSFLSCRQQIFKSIAQVALLCMQFYISSRSRYQLKIITWPQSLDSLLGCASGEFVTETTWTSFCQSCKVTNSCIHKYIGGEIINAMTYIQTIKHF